MNETKKGKTTTKKRRRRQKNKGPKKKPEVVEVSVPKCMHCGFRIRGKNHEEGSHHKNGSGGKIRSTNPWKR